MSRSEEGRFNQLVNRVAHLEERLKEVEDKTKFMVNGLNRPYKANDRDPL
jgi:hypothetical protein